MEARRRPTPEERERRAAAIRTLSENELNVVPVGLSLVGSPIEFDAKKLKAIAREPASKRAESITFYKAQADKHWLAYDLDPLAHEFKEFARAAAKLPKAMLPWAADLIAELRAAALRNGLRVVVDSDEPEEEQQAARPH